MIITTFLFPLCYYIWIIRMKLYYSERFFWVVSTLWPDYHPLRKIVSRVQVPPPNLWILGIIWLSLSCSMSAIPLRFQTHMVKIFLFVNEDGDLLSEL